MNLEEQKTFLLNRLELKKLNEVSNSAELIDRFTQATSGTKIEQYLKKNASEDDKNLDTKVYLVLDKESGEIAFYFAINCGILYSDFDEVNFDNDEIKGAFDWYVSALRKTFQAKTNKEKDDANNEYIQAMETLGSYINDEVELSRILNTAEEMANKKEEKNEAVEGENNIQRVKETFPAIDIKFLCRNKNYKLDIDVDFKLGVFVFWELIVPKILEISDNVGCKYIYLFAADNSENEKNIQPQNLYEENFEDEDKITENNVVRKLVEYYMHELKFNNVTQYKILKPHYERNCYTLVQEVANLQYNRKLVWESHTTDKMF